MLKIKLTSLTYLKIIPETNFCVTAEVWHNAGYLIQSNQFTHLLPYLEIVRWGKEIKL